MKRTLRVISLLCMTLVSLPVLAQGDAENQPSGNTWQETFLVEQQAQEEQAAKSLLILQLMNERQELAGRNFDDSWARRMKAYFGRLSLEELEQARELQQVGEPLPQASIGDPNRDLIFTPLERPCRFYDSRNTAGGRLTPGGGERSLVVAGGAIPANQGAAPFCAVLDSAVAVVINVLAVDPLAKGNFQMWASDGSPGDSVINYGGPNLGINLINGVMIRICNRFLGPCPTDLKLRTNFASSHAVVNVTGFFSPPEPSPLECVTESAFRDVGQTSFNFTSPSCPAGYTLTGGGHDWLTNTQNVWFWEVSPENNRYRCRGRNFNASDSRISCIARCCRIPGEIGGLVL